VPEVVDADGKSIPEALTAGSLVRVRKVWREIGVPARTAACEGCFALVQADPDVASAALVGRKSAAASTLR
jgi:hypothetical protein